MTVPPGVTTSYTLTPGAAPRPISDGGNAPQGLNLINRGDNGGTVWIQSGPAAGGAAVPLQAAGSTTWSDPATIPYAFVLAGATAKNETLIVSSQMPDYSNPVAVATATALQLATTGIPSTFLDQNYGTYRVGAGGTSADINVGPSASLVVRASWPQPGAGITVATLRFDDTLAPDLPEIDLYLTNNNLAEQGDNVWQVPVLAPRLRVTNLAPPDFSNTDLYVSIVGNNRTVPRLRQLGGEMGAQFVSQNLNNTTAEQQVLNTTGASWGGYSPGSRQTRGNGQCTVRILAPVAGTIHPYWVDKNGRAIRTDFAVGAGTTDIPWWHPTVPVYWTFQPNVASAGTLYITVYGGF